MTNLVSIIVGSGYNPVVATGGTVTDITVSGKAWRVHSFTNVGASTFAVSDAGDLGYVEYLIVGGGGAGSLWGGGVTTVRAKLGGGGGAGGLLFGSTVVGNASYPIVVGSGGVVAQTFPVPPTIKGQDSSLFGLTAFGGGAAMGSSNQIYLNGGSGAGSNYFDYAQGFGVSGQGHNGASWGRTRIVSDGIDNDTGGGGGGAGGPALNPGAGTVRPPNGTAGLGGPGLVISITGTSVTYATGGSVNDNSTPSPNAPANTGNGGMGGASNRDGIVSQPGNGGSGIVVIRYPLEAL